MRSKEARNTSSVPSVKPVASARLTAATRRAEGGLGCSPARPWLRNFVLWASAKSSARDSLPMNKPGLSETLLSEAERGGCRWFIVEQDITLERLRH
jgi:hypothetical protein